jgi:hypothetical protein
MNAWREKAKLLVLGALLAIVGQLILRDRTEPTKSYPCAPTAFVAGSPTLVPSRTPPAGQGLPRLLLDALDRLQRVPAAGSRDLFRYVTFHNPPASSSAVLATTVFTGFPSPVKPVETAAEARRPIFYYGYTFRRGSDLVAFLLVDDEIYLARRGAVLRDRYLIAELSFTSLVIEDMASGDRRQISLQGPA